MLTTRLPSVSFFPFSRQWTLRTQATHESWPQEADGIREYPSASRLIAHDALFRCVGESNDSRTHPMKIVFTVSGETGVLWCVFEIRKEILVQSVVVHEEEP